MREAPPADVRIACIVAAVVAMAMAAFGLLADLAATGPLPFDLPGLRLAHRTATPALDRVMEGISVVGAGPVIAGISGVVAVLLSLRRHWGRAFFLAAVLGGALALGPLTKDAFTRPRPHLWPSPAPANGWAFPSGHALSTAAAATAMAVLAWPTRARWWVAGCGATFAVAVGISRVYLQVHYPSDVLAGWALALGWAGAVALTAIALRASRPPAGTTQRPTRPTKDAPGGDHRKTLRSRAEGIIDESHQRGAASSTRTSPSVLSARRGCSRAARSSVMHRSPTTRKHSGPAWPRG